MPLEVEVQNKEQHKLWHKIIPNVGVSYKQTKLADGSLVTTYTCSFCDWVKVITKTFG